MEINYFGAAAAAVFVLQLALCLKRAKLLWRLLPTAALLVGVTACGIVFAASGGFTAGVLGGILVLLLALDGLAWLAAFLVEHRK